nr:methylamine utilization protein [uncultured Halomonas sp.]
MSKADLMNSGYLRWQAPALSLFAVISLTTPAFAASLSINVVDASNGAPLKDAVVELYAPNVAPLPMMPHQISQRGRMFDPHVLAIPVGSAVTFPNLDDTRHHVYSFSPAKTFELALYLNEPTAPVIFDKPGVVVLGCNIHDRMQAFVVVSEAERIAVTDSDGRVTFDGLPEQPMRFTLWHPRLANDHQRREERQAAARGQSIRVPLTLNVPSRPEQPSSSLQRLFDRATQ